MIANKILYVLEKCIEIHAVYKEKNIKMVDAIASRRYVDDMENRENYWIFFVQTEGEAELIGENIKDTKEKSIVIFTSIKINKSLREKLEDREIEVFDQQAMEEIKYIMKAYRNGLNLPNFGRGNLKFFLTMAWKKDNAEFIK